jgi:hypothetical protein
VLYRINDTIYQARIADTQLRETSVIVKDDDVPEVHWVFWQMAPVAKYVPRPVPKPH